MPPPRGSPGKGAGRGRVPEEILARAARASSATMGVDDPRGWGFHPLMPDCKLLPAAVVLVVSLTASGCKRSPDSTGSSRATGTGPVTVLADTGFRPIKDGYKFENQGGHYPRTPPVLTAQDVAKMFGNDVCARGTGTNCKLKPVAMEWMGMVNRAMND